MLTELFRTFTANDCFEIESYLMPTLKMVDSPVLIPKLLVINTDLFSLLLLHIKAHCNKS